MAMGKTCQSIVISAPVDVVWKAIRDFYNLRWAPNVITDVKRLSEIPGDHIGAVRLLNHVFRETLQEFSDKDRTFTYSIDDGPSPVSKDDVGNYVGQVAVRPAPEGDGTLVEWSSSWEGNDEATYAFCHSIYVVLLNDMKKSLEAL